MANERTITGWHVATMCFAALSAVLGAIVLVLLITNRYEYYGYQKERPAASASAPEPTTEIGDVDPSPVPDQGDPDLADKVAVAFSNATGWPYQDSKFDYIFGFTSVGDDLIVKTNLTEPTDQTELCTLLPQLEDPVLGVGNIDQVLITGTDGRVIWTCVPPEG